MFRHVAEPTVIENMPVLTLEERARAIGHLEAGTSVKVVCEMFSISRTACYKLINKKP